MTKACSSSTYRTVRPSVRRCRRRAATPTPWLRRTQGDDWATIYAGGGSAFASTFIPDPVSSAEDSFYTGGGSKDVRDIPAWAYGTTNDVIPDKDDIADAFAAAYTDPDDDHTIIYFGIDRYDNNGDAETGFWFFQDLVSLDGNGGFTGVHTVGDVLVLANWGGFEPRRRGHRLLVGRRRTRSSLEFDSTAADCAVAGANDNSARSSTGRPTTSRGRSPTSPTRPRSGHSSSSRPGSTSMPFSVKSAASPRSWRRPARRIRRRRSSRTSRSTRSSSAMPRSRPGFRYVGPARRIGHGRRESSRPTVRLPTGTVQFSVNGVVWRPG